jgi:hypothetical protein
MVDSELPMASRLEAALAVIEWERRNREPDLVYKIELTPGLGG